MQSFREYLADLDPALPAHLDRFLGDLEALGAYPEMRASLNLNPINFGSIGKSGQFWPNAMT